MPNEANTGTRAYVPGKQVTVAHLIAHPAPEICEKAGIPDVDAIGILTLTPGETAIMGDQLFTDVWSAQLVGVRSIVVPPIRDKKTFFFRFKRALETPFLKKYYRLEKKKHGR